MKKPYAIIIMDGFGLSSDKNVSAICKSGTPNINEMLKKYPSSELKASGMAVGLPEGQMGNSEVGHLNIGAGRIVYQELTRISKAITDGDFFENQTLIKAMDNAKGKKLHLIGLLSDGGVHSHIEHLYALLKKAKDKNIENVFVHCFMDGRDVSPTSGLAFIESLQNYMKEIGCGRIATVSGRYYAMDRDNRWDRVKLAYDAMVNGKGAENANASELVASSYQKEVTDEFIIPTIVDKNGVIEEGDSVICFNFRPDRAREITRALSQKGFNNFEAKDLNPIYVCFTEYDATFENVEVAFKKESMNNTLGEILAKNNMAQLRIAETEKYAHVTFFFNGGVETPNNGEERRLIPSPKVATYDMKPEMSAIEVTDAVLSELDKDKFDVIILNYANCDMVGHTGDMKAAIKAVDTVDNCVKKVIDKILEKDGIALVTADHGNADCMIASDGSTFTAHTTNPVPLIFVSNNMKNVKLENGSLCDIAPTFLSIMGIEIPNEMTGKILIKE